MNQKYPTEYRLCKYRIRKPTSLERLFISSISQGACVSKEQVAKMFQISLKRVPQQIAKIRKMLDKTSLSIGFSDRTFTKYCLYTTKGSFVGKVNKIDNQTNNIIVLSVKRLKHADLSKEKYKLAKDQEKRMKNPNENIAQIFKSNIIKKSSLTFMKRIK
jgi:sporulation protein YlmC with PRC-barrel domain